MLGKSSIVSKMGFIRVVIALSSSDVCLSTSLCMLARRVVFQVLSSAHQLRYI